MDSQEPKHAETSKKAKSTPLIPSFVETMKEKPSHPIVSLQLLNEYAKLKRLKIGERLNEQKSNTPFSTSTSSSQVSTDGIMKMARARLLQFTSQNCDVVSVLINDSFDPNSGISSDDFELALLLHASALRCSNQQFDRARKLLSMCEQSASATGHPLQRLVYYLTEALQKRINRETGRIVPQSPEGNQRRQMVVEEALTVLQPELVACQVEIPFCQVFQFTAIEAILHNVASAKRVHLVDLGVKSGSHLIILMQALADRHECPLELLKLTAVGTSKEMMEAIGKRLSYFAETMKIPFEFKLVLSDMQSLKKDMFEFAADEELAVYSDLRLSSLLAWPDRLECLLRTIRNLRPCVMIIIELEANTNESNFMDRFDESASVCSAILECLEDCMDRDNPCRKIIEGLFLREGLQNLIATEGTERVQRQQRIDPWRAFLTRCGLVDVPLSESALYQAKYIVKNNPRWNNCTLDTDGRCLTLGWKGTPIQTLSVWKVQDD